MPSRLIDKLLISPELNPELKPDLRLLPVVVADNVADYTMEWLADKEGITQKEYLMSLPKIVPPFGSMFIEFRISQWKASAGAILDCYEVDGSDEIKWTIDITFTYDMGDRVIGVGNTRTALNAEGKINLNTSIDPMYLGVFENYHHYVTLGIEAGLYTSEDVQRDLGTLQMIIYWTLAFLNCKNVLLDAVEPSHKENKRRTKHGKLPLVRYHVLKIKPFGPHSDRESQGGTHASPALHIRRGHFKTFTDAAPRFGRDVGTYWYDQAMVGKKSDRIVLKDYEMDLSEVKGDVKDVIENQI